MTIPTIERVVEAYNNSIGSIEKAYDLARGGNLNEAMNQTGIAASSIYQSIEWFLKNYLSKIFFDQSLHKKELDIVHGTPFAKKMNLFIKNATPPINSTGINTTLFTELKQSVRNDPEHSGLVPHLKSLQKVIQETKKLIGTYLTVNTSELKDLPDFQELKIGEISEWQSFLNVCDNFEKNRNYILISGRIDHSGESLKPLGLIEWNAIFDFDPLSEQSGIYKSAASEILAKRAIHKVTLGDNIPTILSANSTYWIFSNGIQGRSQTSFSIFKDWNRNYSPFLNSLIDNLKRNLSDKPTTVVIAFNSFNEINEVVKLLYNHFGGSIKFIFSIPQPTHLGPISENFDGIEVNISLHQISDGILRIRSYFNPILVDEEYNLPHKDHVFVSLKKDDFIWIEEDLEIVHNNIIDGEMSVLDENRIQFYKGKQISWKGLQLNYDLTRDCTSGLESKIERKLRDRTIQKLRLYHYPGIGGTTIARRLAWNLHHKAPVGILKKFRYGETVNRIYKLFQLTSLPPFVIVESSLMNEERFEKLVNEVLVRNFPTLFLWVQRRNFPPSKNSESEVYVSDTLTDLEAGTFANKYAELAPEKKTKIFNILKSSERKERHPLFFGLVAFEETFMGLKEFINRAYQTGTDVQKKIMAFISMSGVYAQRPLSSQLFTGPLMLQETAIVRLEKYLTPELLYLAINESDLKWKTLHYLIGKEFLLQHLGGGNNYDLMRNGLTDLAIDFIDILSKRSYAVTDDEIEVLDRLFIDRSNEDVTENDDESRFSKFIVEGLSDDTARLRVFEKLTQSFPDQPHYWSHLARFYNIKLKNFDDALDSINKAITLDLERHGKDYTLYHIKGMILKGEARKLMSERWGQRNLSREELSRIQDLIEECGEQFLVVRELYSKSDYGYISHIDGITNYIDFKFSISSQPDRSKFMVNMNMYDLELFNKAEDLLEEIQFKNQYDSDNFHITRCKNNIKALFADYNAIIQGWNSLLDPARDTSKTVVRRLLVHAYVDRVSGWENLAQKDADRILTLMEENISSDPNDSRNIFLWFRTARMSKSITVSEAIGKLAKWRITNDSIEPAFYLAILHTIEAIRGNSVSKLAAEELIKETSERSRTYTNRAYCSEWLGKGSNLEQIVHTKEAVSRNLSNELIFDKTKLGLIEGIVCEIKGPEAGTIELSCGLKAFFTPARADSGSGFYRERDNSASVKFLLGFSYDGLRAFEVERFTK